MTGIRPTKISFSSLGLLGMLLIGAWAFVPAIGATPGSRLPIASKASVSSRRLLSTLGPSEAGPSLSVKADQTGAIFLPNEPISYTATISNPSLQSGADTIDYTVHSDTGDVAVTVSVVSTETANVTLSIAAYGYYTVGFALVAPNGAVLDSPQPVSLALIPTPAATTPATNPVGMNGNLQTANPGVPLSNVFQMLQQQGIGWYRLTLSLNSMFPPLPTAPQLAETNAGVLAGEAANINLIAVVSGWPAAINPFATNAKISFATAVSTYCADLQQLVERYKPGGTMATAHH